MNLLEFSVQPSTFIKNEQLVGELATALKTQGVILALQAIKNEACSRVASNPSEADGMLKAVALFQSLAHLVPDKAEFDKTTHFMMEGVGPVSLDLLPEELRKEPEPPK